jgi:exodeoxyribonuclease-1
MAYVFYDFETTGRDAYHDQIIQFAAVRADDDLQPIEHFEVSSRLLASVVPCPEHMRSLLLPATQLENPALPSHYIMMRTIHARLSAWSPAVFLSNEAIAFGEHAFRQALYKTLHNPYLTNTNPNCRTDLTRLVQATFVHAPNALAVPLLDNGRADFNLERVAAANGFTSPLARGPMRAAYACLFLSRLIDTRAPEVWSMFMLFAKKASVENFVRTERVFALSDVYRGRGYRWLMTVLGENPDNSSFLAYNLTIDPEELATFSDARLQFRLTQLPRPLRRLKSNGCPMLAYPDDFPVALPESLDMAEIERRAELVHEDATLRDRLTSTFWLLNPKVAPPDYVEHQIYEGFIEPPDKRRMAAFHDAPSWSKRYEISNQFEDERLRTLALRLIHAEDPSVIPAAHRQAQDRRLARRVFGTDANAPWRSLRSALSEFDHLSASASSAETNVLAGHRARMQARLQHAQAVLA